MKIAANHPSRAHAPSCNCGNCADSKPPAITGLYPHWRDRRSRRLGSVDPKHRGCACAHCRFKQVEQAEYESSDAHTYWRLRRQTRHGWPVEKWEMIYESPIFQLVGEGLKSPYQNDFFENELLGETSGSSPVQYRYLGPIEREKMIKMWQSRRELYGQNKRWQMRISRIIASIKNCQRPHHWRQSEEDIAAQYKNMYPRQKTQVAYQNGVITNTRKGGGSVPDIVLPFAAGQGKGMLLKNKREMELELVEIKRNKVENVSYSDIKKQVEACSTINKGKIQTIILDFRGQENRCADIHLVAGNLAKNLTKDVPQVRTTVQVLLWSGCPNSCSRK